MTKFNENQRKPKRKEKENLFHYEKNNDNNYRLSMKITGGNED